MHVGFVLVALVVTTCGSCNTAPPDLTAGFAGRYYPVKQSPEIDSAEVLHVTYLDAHTYAFRVSGNEGTGRVADSTVTGTLQGPSIGTTPFTFLKKANGTFEFRAFGSRVDLVRLPPAP